jgi:hypothetical protein
MSITLEKKKADKLFNFDLDKMKKALAAPSHAMPSNLSFKEFQEWMKSKSTKD